MEKKKIYYICRKTCSTHALEEGVVGTLDIINDRYSSA